MAVIMKKLNIILILCLIVHALGAETAAEAGKAPVPLDSRSTGESQSGFRSSSELILQATSNVEVKLGFTDHYTFPFLQGESPLTEGNNIALALGAEITPISLNTIAEAVLTPIAFLELSAGGRLGSGWNIEIFGNEIYGIGLNRADADGKSEHSGSAFDGFLWKVQAGGAIQFDLAALYPGDWHHVVARSYHEISRVGYTRAKAGESWYFEGGDGENRNGFNYYGNFLIGYQMPLFINTIALLAEGDLYLYDTPNRSRWGDDKIRWTFSAVTIFTITEKIELTLATQFVTRRNYKESDWEDLFYRNRHIDNSNPTSLEFDRIAAVLTYKF